MEKLSPKLIALDLDDTLLNKETQIPEENVKALQKCAEKGIYVVLCSGRAEEGILPFVRKLDIAGKQAGRFLIAINGCSVFDLHLRQQIFKRTVMLMFFFVQMNLLQKTVWILKYILRIRFFTEKKQSGPALM